MIQYVGVSLSAVSHYRLVHIYGNILTPKDLSEHKTNLSATQCASQHLWAQRVIFILCSEARRGKLSSNSLDKQQRLAWFCEAEIFFFLVNHLTTPQMYVSTPPNLISEHEGINAFVAEQVGFLWEQTYVFLHGFCTSHAAAPMSIKHYLCCSFLNPMTTAPACAYCACLMWLSVLNICHNAVWQHHRLTIEGGVITCRCKAAGKQRHPRP